MRIDHFAYQRATRVAGFGLFLQAALAVVLLWFSITTGTAGDTACLFGALYALCGLPAWVSLLVLFHQHKLERLESLEQDELTAGRDTALFETDDEIRVAGRRLRKMHHWLMPGVSLLLVLVLGVVGWRMWAFMAAQKATGDDAVDVAEFALTPALGWAVAICLAFSAVSFIFSRFVAGMAKQPAWQNLRGGAGFMVGNALVMLAIAVGVVFRFFEKDQAIEGIAVAIPILMFLQAGEIGLNFILNMYRPRIPGEVPRPAFDSRVLSMLAAPDSLVRSINEAVNYQFGFDVTSTWGYKLLMRSVAKLVVLGIIVLLLISTMVVVEPHQQAVRLARGRIVGDVYGSGLMLKLPWPLQSASIHDVTRVRELPLTARRRDRQAVTVWDRKLEGKTDSDIEPFIVRRTDWTSTVTASGGVRPGVEGSSAGFTQDQALVHAEVVLQYRIRSGDDGLLDFLSFVPDTTARRERFSMREKALRGIALREVSDHLAKMTVDEVLARNREHLAVALGQRIQEAFDDVRTGVEVVDVAVPLIRPAGENLTEFEDLTLASQDVEQYVATADRQRLSGLAYLVGDASRADEVVAEIQTYNRLRAEHGPDHATAMEQQEKIERMLIGLGGNAGQEIGEAYTDRWSRILSAKAEAARVLGQLATYRAAPDLYRVRERMRVIRHKLMFRDKFVIATDPSRVALEVEFQKLSTALDFAMSIKDEGQGGSP